MFALRGSDKYELPLPGYLLGGDFPATRCNLDYLLDLSTQGVILQVGKPRLTHARLDRLIDCLLVSVFVSGGVRVGGVVCNRSSLP